MGAKTDFSFDDFAELCPTHDIERFRESYDILLDLNGAVHSHTVGFHFSFDDNDPSRLEEFKEMVKLFQPVALWAGSTTLRQQLTDMGYTAKRFPFFEGGGFMVVLKIPAQRRQVVVADTQSRP